MKECYKNLNVVRSVNGMTGDVVIEGTEITKEYIKEQDEEYLSKSKEYTEEAVSDIGDTLQTEIDTKVDYEEYQEHIISQSAIDLNQNNKISNLESKKVDKTVYDAHLIAQKAIDDAQDASISDLSTSTEELSTAVEKIETDVQNKVNTTDFEEYKTAQAEIDSKQTEDISNKQDILKTWLGTANDYGKITEKDNNTFYFIKPDTYTLRFRAVANGNISFNNRTTFIQYLEYSYNNTDWVEITDLNTDVPLSIGQTLYVRGDNPNGFNIASNYMTIKCSSSMIMSGDIMSLLYPTEEQNTKVIPNTYCFYYLFRDNTNLDIDDNFKMSATTLKSGCYSAMFYNCRGLTKAPELPATTLIGSCYDAMFSRCESLSKAPELSATTLVSTCYKNMFNSCTSLNYIKIGTTSWNETYASNWVNNVSSTGTFVKPTGTNIPTGVNGIPSGWTVEEV